MYVGYIMRYFSGIDCDYISSITSAMTLALYRITYYTHRIGNDSTGPIELVYVHYTITPPTAT